MPSTMVASLRRRMDGAILRVFATRVQWKGNKNQATSSQVALIMTKSDMKIHEVTGIFLLFIKGVGKLSKSMLAITESLQPQMSMIKSHGHCFQQGFID